MATIVAFQGWWLWRCILAILALLVTYFSTWRNKQSGNLWIIEKSCHHKHWFSFLSYCSSSKIELLVLSFIFSQNLLYCLFVVKVSPFLFCQHPVSSHPVHWPAFVWFGLDKISLYLYKPFKMSPDKDCCNSTMHHSGPSFIQ